MTHTPHRLHRQALLFSLAVLLGLCGASHGSIPSTVPPDVTPTQEWIYVVIDSRYWNGGGQTIVIMTKNGHVVFRNDLDLATVTYDFTGIVNRNKFNLLKQCFGIKTITPAQIGDLFGVPVTIAYAYAWNTGPIVHTAQQFFAAFSAGFIKQNSVTINIVE